MRKLICGLSVIMVAACSGSPPPDDKNTEQLMVVTDNSLTTSDALAFKISMPNEYPLKGPDYRTDIFDNTPYLIARGAFIGTDAVMLVHAERVQDVSGASNYDNSAVASWPSSEFRSSGAICMEISADDISGETDPEWLVKQGFDLIGPVMYAQYFTTTSDHNREIVISLIQRVSTCQEAAINDQAMTELKSKISVVKLGQ